MWARRTVDIKSLREKGDERGLLNALKPNNSPEIRLAVANALRWLANPKSAKTLQRYLEDDNLSTELRQALTETLETAQFVQRATQGKGNIWKCTARIGELYTMYYAIVVPLRKQAHGSSREAISYFDQSIRGRCPECETKISGPMISSVGAMQENASKMIYIDDQESSARMMQGKCPNAKCISTTIELYWR
jgi:hypothetical protein